MEHIYKGIHYTIWDTSIKMHPDDDGLMMTVTFSITGHGSGEVVTYPLTPANAMDHITMIEKVIDMLLSRGELTNNDSIPF